MPFSSKTRESQRRSKNRYDSVTNQKLRKYNQYTMGLLDAQQF
jgi:hypothetical protein